LIVYTDGVLSSPITSQLFKTVAGRGLQVYQGVCCV